MKTMIVAAAITTLLFETPDRHRDIEDHFAAKPSQRIELRGFNGSDIKVRTWDKQEVSVKLSIDFSASDERVEERYLNSAVLKQDQSEDALRITFQDPDFPAKRNDSFWSWLTNMFRSSFVKKEMRGEISVPRSNALAADISYGTVSFEGLNGQLQVNGSSNTMELRDCSSLGDVGNNYGKLTIANCGGSLRLSSRSATISIDQFSGPAFIDADYSTITVRDLKQILTINSRSATIRINGIGADVRIRSDYSSITASDIRGAVEILDKSGSIKVKSVDGIKVDGDYSSMEISNVAGNKTRDIVLSGQSASVSLVEASGKVRIDNPYGAVDLRDIRGDVGVKSKSSRVTADGVTGDWDSMTEYCTIAVRDLRARTITMSNSSGGIDISLKSAPTTVDIRNTYANVLMEMPSGFSGDVDLNTTYGHIESNLPLTKSRTSETGTSYSMGKIGNGSGKISVETKSGNVSVVQR